ncbi:MAG: sigma factor-like helix-turn-helix DNA-binding protein [Evtepia gabavorous]
MVEKVALHTAINRLPERERKLIFLRYYKGFTQDKTAKVLGISQVQVPPAGRCKSILFLAGAQ